MVAPSEPLREGDLLTAHHALKLLPVGKSLLYQLADEGQIEVIRVASAGSRRGRVLFERAAIEEYVARLRGEAPKRSLVNLDVDQLLARVRRTGHG